MSASSSNKIFLCDQNRRKDLFARRLRAPGFRSMLCPDHGLRRRTKMSNASETTPLYACNYSNLCPLPESLQQHHREQEKCIPNDGSPSCVGQAMPSNPYRMAKSGKPGMATNSVAHFPPVRCRRPIEDIHPLY